VVVATFYVLPSPLFLGKAFERPLQELFPSVLWNDKSLQALAEQVNAAVARHSDVYVIHRHELPEGEELLPAVVYGYGAEPGDEVIEICGGKRLGDWHIRRHEVNRAT
jgi:hypothetical protein